MNRFILFLPVFLTTLTCILGIALIMIQDPTINAEFYARRAAIEYTNAQIPDHANRSTDMLKKSQIGTLLALQASPYNAKLWEQMSQIRKTIESKNAPTLPADFSMASDANAIARALKKSSREKP